MKTLRALFWGSAVGLLLGKLFAPRQTDLLRAELAERQGVPEATGYRPAGSRSSTA